MKGKRVAEFLTVTFCCTLNACSQPKPEAIKQVEGIVLPPGFQITVYADNVPGARSMTLGSKGTVFVGTREYDKVYALVDRDNNGFADVTHEFTQDVNNPNGVAFHDGDLYIAEISRILKIDDVESRLDKNPKPVLIYDKLPDKKHHGWKYIAVGPDNKLYIPIGAPCNVCDDAERDERFASMCRVDLNGENFELYASGIRNTVGFDWHPVTKELWFTDNGRDMMGDNLPPDELNRAARKGLHFGYPYYHGNNIKDPEFGNRRNETEFQVPVRDLGPHVAALGMKFYRGNMFPPEYRNQVFIAEHGSWNRSSPIGYRITVVRESNGSYSYEPFAEGWLNSGKVSGRPVDVLELKDGSLLVSDDMEGKIYRITYNIK